MGHLTTFSREHRALLMRLGAGPVALPEPKDERARAGWQEILEILFTREDAALAARLPITPASLEAIAWRVQRSPQELKPQLDRMADKGIVTDLVDPATGKTTYQLSPPIVGFFEFSMMRASDMIPKRRMAEALDAYEHGDDTFAREAFDADTVVGRALVHETALPQDALPDVLDWERATALIEEARSLSVQRCYCRQKAEYLGRPCDVPIERCLALNYGADFLVRHGFARRIDRSEAKEILAASRQDNLVQIADNVRDTPTFICNCCPCHCGLIGGLTEFDLPAVNPSAFQAASNLDLCKGCSRCSRACPVGAITMAPLRLYGQRKNKLMPVIDTDRCIGCGVCADQCRQHAMHMERRPARPHVPVNSVERIVRMSLERGRLPHLLFDAGKNRSSRFFNSVLRALCALPPVEKALASNQVRSRFVDYALKNIKAPA